MGVGLSCLGGQSSTQEKLMKPSSSNNPDDETACGGRSVLEFFKSGCFSTRDHQPSGCSRNNRYDDEEMKMKMQRSLGDWLAEPSPTSGRTTFGSSRESFVFMSFSKKVHPSSSVNPRDSFSKEKLLKDENTGEDGGLRRSQSQKKLKKKVSFSLPEDNEVIIFPPSPESEEEVIEDES